jgi:exodeoxyribonuclease V gamma subunit
MTEGDSKAEGAWLSDRTRSESDDAALRIAFRGTSLTLDETFGTLAKLVFEPLLQHLRSDA